MQRDVPWRGMPAAFERERSAGSTAVAVVCPAREGSGNQSQRSFPCCVHGLSFDPDTTENQAAEALALARLVRDAVLGRGL